MIINGGDYYHGLKATENDFKQKALDYFILHVALHREVDYDIANKSKTYSIRAKSDSLEDERFHPFELYNMDLNADQAVLSAPETGAGKITRGEGIMSLGRAYIHLNARACRPAKKCRRSSEHA